MSASPVIEVGQLNVGYGDFPAVRNLSSQVERGGFYALLGTNGAGKTPAQEVIEGTGKPSLAWWCWARGRLTGARVPGWRTLAVVSE